MVDDIYLSDGGNKVDTYLNALIPYQPPVDGFILFIFKHYVLPSSVEFQINPDGTVVRAFRMAFMDLDMSFIEVLEGGDLWVSYSKVELKAFFFSSTDQFQYNRFVPKILDKMMLLVITYSMRLSQGFVTIRDTQTALPKLNN